MIKDLILRGEELAFENGDLVVADGGEQMCELLANSTVGEWKNAPMAGWDVRKYVAAPQTELSRLVPKISEDLKYNGIMSVVSEDKGEINIKLL